MGKGDPLGGRPLADINKQMFENLCKIQCTKEELCGTFMVDEKTLTRWCKATYGKGFSDIRDKKAKEGKASLRRMQWKVAEAGNPTLLIWLGKNMLDQTDKTEISGKDGGDLVIKVIRA